MDGRNGFCLFKAKVVVLARRGGVREEIAQIASLVFPARLVTSSKDPAREIEGSGEPRYGLQPQRLTFPAHLMGRMFLNRLVSHGLDTQFPFSMKTAVGFFVPAAWGPVSKSISFRPTISVFR